MRDRDGKPASPGSTTTLQRSPSFPSGCGAKSRGAKVSKLPPLLGSQSATQLGPPPEHLVKLLRKASVGAAELTAPLPRQTSEKLPIRAVSPKRANFEETASRGVSPKRRGSAEGDAFEPQTPSSVSTPSGSPKRGLDAELRGRTPPSGSRGSRRRVPPIEIAWSKRGSSVAVGDSFEQQTPTGSEAGGHFSEEVSRVANMIYDDLDNMMRQLVETSEAREAALKEAESEPIKFEDPVLQRAREVSAMVKSRRQLRPTPHDDVSVLVEISSTSVRVDRELTELLEQSWAEGVWKRDLMDEVDLENAPQQLEEDAGGDAAGAEEEAEESDMIGKLKAYHIEGLPSVREKLKQVANANFNSGQKHEFSEVEIQRIQTAFLRYKVPGTNDLHADVLSEVLQYLGHLLTNGEAITELKKEITGYEYLDFDEFLEFMYSFVRFERNELERIFKEFDEDQSGEYSIGELRKLMIYLGVTPLRAMMTEALEMVDVDQNGNLGLREVLQFLIVYKHAECFTRDEVDCLRHVFDKFAENGACPVEVLDEAVCRVFGDQIEDSARQRQAELKAGKGDPDGLVFFEFLIFARQARDAIRSEFHKQIDEAAFKQADEDGDRLISYNELCKHLVREGNIPLRNVIHEICAEVGTTDRDNFELDMDEFFDFLLIYRQRDGFMKKDVEEFMTIFRRFDDEGEEEIKAVGLGDIFRFLGYSPSPDQVQDFVSQVDANGSGDLDFREFLRLMQHHRKAELTKMRKTFDHYARGGTLPHKNLLPALRALDQNPSSEMMLQISSGPEVDYDDFVEITDTCRKEWVLKQRKKAGFSNSKIAEFKESFSKLDKDGSGSIDSMELQSLLQMFNWQPKTKEEQLSLIERLDLCRELAEEAGVEDISAKGCGELKFWEFVQLARQIMKDIEAAQARKFEELTKELKFNPSEVDQFRQVFNSWTVPDVDENGEIQSEEEEHKVNHIHRDIIKRRLKGVGVDITPQNTEELIAKLESFEEDHKYTFVSFLKTMRWLLDTNFGDIAKTDGKKPTKAANSFE